MYFDYMLNVFECSPKHFNVHKMYKHAIKSNQVILNLQWNEHKWHTPKFFGRVNYESKVKTTKG